MRAATANSCRAPPRASQVQPRIHAPSPSTPLMRARLAPVYMFPVQHTTLTLANGRPLRVVFIMRLLVRWRVRCCACASADCESSDVLELAIAQTRGARRAACVAQRKSLWCGSAELRRERGRKAARARMARHRRAPRKKDARRRGRRGARGSGERWRGAEQGCAVAVCFAAGGCTQQRCCARVRRYRRGASGALWTRGGVGFCERAGRGLLGQRRRREREGERGREN